MAVPYTFGTATASIPLSNLDSNFATTITLGNTAIQLGNTVTTLNNMTLVTPALGTPSSINLSNATALPKAALPTGSVLQVVNASYSVQTSSSSSSYADTGLTATITPTSASSKILVLVSQVGIAKLSSDTGVGVKLLRGATLIVQMETLAGANGSIIGNYIGATSTAYLDSPATTSATTYKTQFNSFSNTASAQVQTGSVTSTITLMEIAA